MDPIQYELLQKEVTLAMETLEKIKKDIHSVYLRLGPAKEAVRSLEREKTKAKRLKKKKLETDFLLQVADKNPEDSS